MRCSFLSLALILSFIQFSVGRSLETRRLQATSYCWKYTNNWTFGEILGTDYTIKDYKVCIQSCVDDADCSYVAINKNNNKCFNRKSPRPVLFNDGDFHTWQKDPCPAPSCPDEWSQVGRTGDALTGQIWSDKVTGVQKCQEECISKTNCAAFTITANGGNPDHPYSGDGTSIYCTLYSSVTVSSSPGVKVARTACKKPLGCENGGRTLKHGHNKYICDENDGTLILETCNNSNFASSIVVCPKTSEKNKCPTVEESCCKQECFKKEAPKKNCDAEDLEHGKERWTCDSAGWLTLLTCNDGRPASSIRECPTESEKNQCPTKHPDCCRENCFKKEAAKDCVNVKVPELDNKVVTIKNGESKESGRPKCYTCDCVNGKVGCKQCPLIKCPDGKKFVARTTGPCCGYDCVDETKPKGEDCYDGSYVISHGHNSYDCRGGYLFGTSCNDGFLKQTHRQCPKKGQENECKNSEYRKNGDNALCCDHECFNTWDHGKYLAILAGGIVFVGLSFLGVKVVKNYRKDVVYERLPEYV